MPADAQVVDINLSIYFGSVRIFVAKDREPKTTDFDYSSGASGEQDFLRIVSYCLLSFTKCSLHHLFA